MCCGLGNQGGSLTLVRSANALVELGHDITIIDEGRNQHTWTSLKAKHVICRDPKRLLEVDVVIATGFKTVGSTLKMPAKLKVHWLRGWELWQMNEAQIVKKVLGAPTVKVVNSVGLQRKLADYRVESFIIRPGNDLEDFYPLNIRNKTETILGGLYHSRHRTKRADWVLAIAAIIKTKNKNVKLWMFGTDSDPYNPIIDRYFKKPNIKTKNKFYNRVDVWISSSNLEGLHIVPQEVMLTECPVVTTNAPLAGTADYIIDKETGLVARNDLTGLIGKVGNLVQDPKLQGELGKRGRQKIIELGDRRTNMKKMVELFEGLLR